MAAVDYRLEAPELVRDFLQYHETIKNHSIRTVDAYYIDLRLFLRFVKWNHELVPQDTPFAEIAIRDINLDFIHAIKKADIYDFLSWLARDRQGKKQMGLSVPARARKLVAVRSFFDYLLLKRELIASNPAADIDAPRLRKTLPVYLNEPDAVKLLDAVRGPYAERDFCILLLLLSCGMRVSELAGLNLGKIERSVEVILLPVDEEKPRRAAIQARPFERGERAFADMGTEFFARKARGSVRGDAAQSKPVLAHILGDGVDDAACDPVAAIEAGHEALVGGEAGEGVFAGGEEVGLIEAETCEGVLVCVTHDARGRLGHVGQLLCLD